MAVAVGRRRGRNVAGAVSTGSARPSASSVAVGVGVTIGAPSTMIVPSIAGVRMQYELVLAGLAERVLLVPSSIGQPIGAGRPRGVRGAGDLDGRVVRRAGSMSHVTVSPVWIVTTGCSPAAHVVFFAVGEARLTPPFSTE